MRLAIAIVIAAQLGFLQSAATWRDPSPHQVRWVTVEPSVTLEVLDWGGSGRPLLFIGCYLTGHVYDEIAPRLTDQFRVYAVTRRGVGASDRPNTGYDPQRRAQDILDVMSALRMERPILVGNSCGGGILHTLGAQHPDRIGGLVYLDAAEDPTLKLSDYPAIAVDMSNLPKPVRKETRVQFPEAEQRASAERPVTADIRKAIVQDHNVRPDYARIRVPVLAIYRTTTLAQAFEQFPPQDEGQLGAVITGYAAGRAMVEKWQSDLRAGVPNARIVELPGANLYMFLSNEADVIREVRDFAATLKR